MRRFKPVLDWYRRFFYTIWESVMRILCLLMGIGMGMGYLMAIMGRGFMALK
jgi:hypothetical protein